MASIENAVFKVTINGPIDAVWREITRTDIAQKCMFNMKLHTTGLRPGAPVRMRTISGKYTGVVGEVLEFDPPRKYSHTFKFTNYDDPPCTVTYELRELSPGVTEFTLLLTDVPAGTKTAKQMKQGGTMIVNTLKRIVETGKPSFGVRSLYVLFKVLEPLNPKRARSENWPLERAV
jgi:uncharacterized protein YndB with AHSA1/START domain